jgi:hypothetical protein
MFPLAPDIIMFELVIMTVIGMMFGMLAGFPTSVALRLGRKGIWKDAILGGIGLLVGLFAAFTLPWPENTTTTLLSGGGVEQVTMRHFPHPFLVGNVFATIFPILRHLYRFSRSRATLKLEKCHTH